MAKATRGEQRRACNGSNGCEEGAASISKVEQKTANGDVEGVYRNKEGRIETLSTNYSETQQSIPRWFVLCKSPETKAAVRRMGDKGTRRKKEGEVR